MSTPQPVQTLSKGGLSVGYLAVQGAINLSDQDAITALAGGGQTGATPMTKTLNRIATVATIADSVMLPPSAAGLLLFVVNGATNSMQVFGAGTDTINDVTYGTGVAHAGGKSAIYFCPVAGKWYRVLSA